MIAEILGHGREAAKTAKAISSYLGIKTTRQLAKMIQAERQAGAPICATNSFPYYGYFLAANAEEMQSFCGSLSRRLKEIERTRAACQRTIDKLPSRESGRQYEESF